jgi:hypothetical protein
VTVRSAWHYNSPAQSPGQTRADTRLTPVGTMTPETATTTRAGVVPGGTGLNLTGTGMTGTIAIGRAVIQGTTTQGAYPFAVTVADSFVVANGHASLPRIDSVFAVIYDSLYDASGQTLAAIVVVAGTPNASPTAPSTVPNSNAYLKLWEIRVEANSSAGTPIDWSTKLTDRRVYTVGLGGIVLGAANGAYAGQFRDAGGASGILERYNGSAWESRLYLGTSGQVVIGSDVNLYRQSANVLKTDDALQVAGALTPLGGISNLPSSFVEDTTTRTSTSASYNALGSTLFTTVVAPPSGKVRVTLQGKIQAVGSGGNPCFAGPLITGSTTPTIYSPTDIHSIATFGVNDYILQSVTRTFTAVPGETVTVVFQGRAAAGTCTLLYRNLTVEALAG